LIIQIARKGDTIDEEELLRYDGMRKVFLRISDKDGDNDVSYNYLAPWNLLKGKVSHVEANIAAALKS
jgi:hypothetical protein